MKYRKKPVVIDAQCWLGTADTATPIIDWILEEGGTARYVDYPHENRALATARINIDTLEGMIAASPGDWIIKGVQGEFYPCKPDIFDATYEAVSYPQEAAAERAVRTEP